MTAPDSPQAAFRIGSVQVSEAGIALHQHVTADLVDHRGVVEMPAYAVLAESVTSGAYWYSFTEPVATVQSWLALTAGAPVRVGDRLHGASVLSHHDDRYGTATVTVTNGSHQVVCSGVARCTPARATATPWQTSAFTISARRRSTGVP
jgi:hypothetical protein